MADAIQSLDWSFSPIGAPSAWQRPLQVLVSFMLESGQPMFIAWGPSRVLLYNDSYIPLLGTKHPHALGQSFFDVWPEGRSEFSPFFDRVFSGERIEMDDFTFRLDRGNGIEEAHFAFSCSPLRDDESNIAGLFCICRETTRAVLNKQAEDLEKERLARMFEKAPSFIALLEGAEHRFVLANARYMELVGNRPIIGRSLADALPEAVAQGYLRLLDDVFRTNQPFTMAGAKYLAHPAAGEPARERFLDFVYQPISDGNGRVTGIFVEGSDVTERVRTELLARESTEQLQRMNENLEQRISERTAQLIARETLIRTFYQHSSECHAVLAEAGEGAFRYEEINPATLALYGMTREEVIGRTVDEVFDPQDASVLNAHLAACLRSNAPYVYERVHGDGIVEAIATPVPVQLGVGRRVLVSARDVSERRRLEQQLRQAQKMDAIGHLTGGIAHDFNNLLMGISGSLELVQSRLSQGRLADVERYINAGQGAARRAAALTHRLLAFARRQTLDAKPTDVNRLVSEMVDLIRRTVGPEINVDVVGAVGLWNTLVDANQLENALLNLCINARDAMPTGGKITIETANRWIDDRMAIERDLPRGQYISLCVTDTGCGMSADVIASAFDPFFTTKPIGQGTGLGLSMIYGFAKQSGGQARIYSEAGHGATVCIYLPRFLGGGADSHYAADLAPAPLAVQGETVLVVDDESVVRMLVMDVLHDLGYAAIESNDGVTALKILESQQRIDLLITDVGLPNGINGRQLADAARILRPKLKVLFITGYAENAVLSHANLDSGFEVLSKPFAIEILTSRISALMTRATGDLKDQRR